MKTSFNSTIEEELTQCFFNITGLIERVKGFNKIPEIHLQTAIEQIRTYDSLRKTANLPKEQLIAYDKVIDRAKRFFEYIG